MPLFFCFFFFFGRLCPVFFLGRSDAPEPNIVPVLAWSPRVDAQNQKKWAPEGWEPKGGGPKGGEVQISLF